MDAPMRILMVAPVAPFPPVGGAPMRNYQLLRHLARRHSVSLVASSRPEWPGAEAALAELCDAVRIVKLDFPVGARKRRSQLGSLFTRTSYLERVFASKPMQDAVDELLKAQSFDIIQVESALMAPLRFESKARLVLDEHNIEYEVLKRASRIERAPARKLYNRIEYLKTRRQEHAAWQRVDGCVVTSEREAAILSAVVPGKPVTVVPNGVDLDDFSPAGDSRANAGIVFTGRLDYRPNIDAVLYFVREILPRVVAERPSTRLTIVGMGVPPEISRLATKQVTITGAVPDVRPYLSHAAVAIAPLRMGGGTRLKLLEAMAMGKAIVTTAIGCEGLSVRHGTHLLVADDPGGFAQEVLRLLGDAPLASKLGCAARQLVEADYGWESVAGSLEDFHQAIASGTGELDPARSSPGAPPAPWPPRPARSH